MFIKAGEALELPCVTNNQKRIPVTWFYAKVGTKDNIPIFSSNTITDAYAHKISVRKASEGEYTLLFSSVQPSDRGKYTCVDNAGLGPDNATADITILGKLIDHFTFSSKFNVSIKTAYAHRKICYYNLKKKASKFLQDLNESY